MPAFNQTATSGAVAFAMKTSHLFVISSLLAALGALLALQGVAWVFCLGAALIFFLSALLLGSGRKGALALTISFLSPFFMAQDRLARLYPSSRDLSQLRANVVSFSGRVLTSKIKDTDQGRLMSLEVGPDRLLLPWSKELGGKVLVHIGPYTQEPHVTPIWGGKYVFTGRLTKPRTRVFSFEFDERRRLALQDIYCQVSCSADGVQDLSQEPGAKPTSGQDRGPEPDQYLGQHLDHKPGQQPSIERGQGQVKKQGQCALKQIEECAVLIVQDTVKLREGIVNGHIRVLGDERGKLLTSMVLGDRAVSLSDSIKAAFARVGLSHLLAASGLNLTIIVGAVIFLFAMTRRSKRPTSNLMQTMAALVCVLFFVSLAGASPSVTRATIMCLLLLWSSLVFRRLATGSALAFALWLALLLDPLSILDVGLELSYGATFGIIYFYPIFVAALPARLAKKPWHWLCAICAVVLSAQLAVLPVQIYYFQKISTLVLPANMLAEPLVAPITVMGFLSSLVSAMAIVCNWVGASVWGTLGHLPLLAQVLVQISSIIDFFSGYLIDLLLGLTRYLGSLPLSYLYLAKPSAAAVVLYYLALVVAFVVGLSRPGRGALVALTVGLLLTLQSFLMSSCLELLVTQEKVVVVSPLEPPLLLMLPEVQAGEPSAEKFRVGSKGYLPAFHRDFVLSYLRSLTGRGECTTRILESTNYSRNQSQCQSQTNSHFGGGSNGLDDLLWCDSHAIASLYLKGVGPELVSALPFAAIEIEEAQGVKLYKLKTWGLGCLWIRRLWPNFAAH